MTDKEELFQKLKSVSDFYILILHQIKGYHSDSIIGFGKYLEFFQKVQAQSLATNPDIASMEDLDKAQMIYSTGDPDDPNALMAHECTQGQLKERLKKGGFNEILTSQFCLVMMYEYWEGGIRAALAKVLNQEVAGDIFGDMRRLRHDIIHNKGFASKEYSQKADILTWFKEGEPLNIDEKKFDQITSEIFDFFNDLIMRNTGQVAYEDKSLSLVSKKRQMDHIKAGNMKVER